MSSPPSAPVKTGGPAVGSTHRDLYERVISAIHALPERFETSLRIEGVPATDLFTMNSALGAAIESSVVDSLNSLRDLWDPTQRYADYYFIRQSQRFPDVLLTTTSPTPPYGSILFGVELKGWFVISKEGEPSFRYKISPGCCDPSDLLVVIPWAFNSVVSGAPRLLTPIVCEAAHAAYQRNYHWEWIRANPQHQAQSLRGVDAAPHQAPYPTKSDRSSDIPKSDSGGNFGRIARCGVMDSEVASILASPLLGIPVDAWRRFLQVFSDGASPAAIAEGIGKLEGAFRLTALPEAQREAIADVLNDLSSALRG